MRGLIHSSVGAGALERHGHLLRHGAPTRAEMQPQGQPRGESPLLLGLSPSLGFPWAPLSVGRRGGRMPKPVP